MRSQDGSAGDADYGTIGSGYTNYRQPDPFIFSQILKALGDAETVLNVGAGAGSYEPQDRTITAVEPSASMRAQRPPSLVTAIEAVAESLPFPDRSFDASMATFTVHQWQDLKAGLSEMRRVTKGPVVILSCDPKEVESFWLSDYAPLVLSTEARRYPSAEAIKAGLSTEVKVHAVSIPFDCKDGFNEAYYGRPEMFLQPGARKANSAWSFVDTSLADQYIADLEADLKSGQWDERLGRFRSDPYFEGSLRLIVSL